MAPADPENPRRDVRDPNSRTYHLKHFSKEGAGEESMTGNWGHTHAQPQPPESQSVAVWHLEVGLEGGDVGRQLLGVGAGVWALQGLVLVVPPPPRGRANYLEVVGGGVAGQDLD